MHITRDEELQQRIIEMYDNDIAEGKEIATPREYFDFAVESLDESARGQHPQHWKEGQIITIDGQEWEVVAPSQKCNAWLLQAKIPRAIFYDRNNFHQEYTFDGEKYCGTVPTIEIIHTFTN